MGKIGYCSSAYLKSKSELDSVTNKPESSDDISSSMQVKSYAYYTGTITATGTKPEFGRTIAVDPIKKSYLMEVEYTYLNLIKHLLQKIVVEEFKGNKIDIYMNTEQECLNWGVRNITIYILK